MIRIRFILSLNGDLPSLTVDDAKCMIIYVFLLFFFNNFFSFCSFKFLNSHIRTSCRSTPNGSTLGNIFHSTEKLFSFRNENKNHRQHFSRPKTFIDSRVHIRKWNFSPLVHSKWSIVWQQADRHYFKTFLGISQFTQFDVFLLWLTHTHSFVVEIEKEYISDTWNWFYISHSNHFTQRKKCLIYDIFMLRKFMRYTESTFSISRTAEELFFIFFLFFCSVSSGFLGSNEIIFSSLLSHRNQSKCQVLKQSNKQWYSLKTLFCFLSLRSVRCHHFSIGFGELLWISKNVPNEISHMIEHNENPSLNFLPWKPINWFSKLLSTFFFLY